MEYTKTGKYIAVGDLLLLVGKDKKELIVRIREGGETQTHHGVVRHDDLIEKHCWGDVVLSHIGYAYTLLPPSLEHLIRNIKRNTQIVYPKDIGYILVQMNIGPGTQVIEAGTGSGGLTLAMARMVMPHGHIYTYEIREEMQNLARKNLDYVGLSEYVTFKVRDIEEGFDEQNVDVVFLDVREPWHYLSQVHTALKGGGFFGALLPTTNQVSVLLRHLERNNFGYMQVEEILLRHYKAVPARLRPVDRMVAHTGYLVFSRAITAVT